MNMLSFHNLASIRGDGLDPRFVEFLKHHAAAPADNVEDITAYRPGEMIQAGPSPSGQVDDVLPPGVIRFPSEPQRDSCRKTAAS
jgi:hypothetical protein